MKEKQKERKKGKENKQEKEEEIIENNHWNKNECEG